jgi:hypothetical protein
VLLARASRPRRIWPPGLPVHPTITTWSARSPRGAAACCGEGRLWFFAFCATWAGLAVALSDPPYSYSARHIGLYASAGLSGVLATQIAGRCTDRFGPRTVILVGLLLAVLATVVLATGLHSSPVTLAGLAAFDAGLFTAQVAKPWLTPETGCTVRTAKRNEGAQLPPVDRAGWRLAQMPVEEPGSSVDLERQDGGVSAEIGVRGFVLGVERVEQLKRRRPAPPFVDLRFTARRSRNAPAPSVS